MFMKILSILLLLFIHFTGFSQWDMRPTCPIACYNEGLIESPPFRYVLANTGNGSYTSFVTSIGVEIVVDKHDDDLGLEQMVSVAKTEFGHILLGITEDRDLLAVKKDWGSSTKWQFQYSKFPQIAPNEIRAVELENTDIVIASSAEGPNDRSQTLLLKLNTEGEFLDSLRINTDGDFTVVNSLIETSDGNIILAGRKRFDGYLEKLNTNFEQIWVSLIDESEGIIFEKIIELEDGGFLCLAFGTPNTSQEDSGCRILKYSSDGNLLSNTAILQDSILKPSDMVLTPDNNLYVVGGISDGAAGTGEDPFLIKLNEDFQIEWQRIFEDSGPGFIEKIIVSSLGQLVFSVFDDHTIRLISANQDGIVTSNTDILKTPNVKIFPNPNNGIFEIEQRDGKIERIELYNIHGTRIAFLYEEKNGNSLHNIPIDISAQVSGSYIVKVYTEQGVVTQRVIKI